MKISNSVIKSIIGDIEEMFSFNQASMEAAYLRAGDDPLDVSVKVKIGEKGAKIKTVSTINFVKDRCQDKRSTEIDEDQINLFKEMEVYTSE